MNREVARHFAASKKSRDAAEAPYSLCTAKYVLCLERPAQALRIESEAPSVNGHAQLVVVRSRTRSDVLNGNAWRVTEKRTMGLCRLYTSLKVSWQSSGNEEKLKRRLGKLATFAGLYLWQLLPRW